MSVGDTLIAGDPREAEVEFLENGAHNGGLAGGLSAVYHQDWGAWEVVLQTEESSVHRVTSKHVGVGIRTSWTRDETRRIWGVRQG